METVQYKALAELVRQGRTHDASVLAQQLGFSLHRMHQELMMTQTGAQINHDISHEAAEVQLHTHPFYEILFVCRGSNVQYLLGNQRYALQKGDILLIPPGMAHRPMFLKTLCAPYDRFALWIDAAFFEAQCVMFPELRYALDCCRETDCGLLRSSEAVYSGLYADFNALWKEQTKQAFGWQAAVAHGALHLLLHISRVFYYRDAQMGAVHTRSLFDDVFQYVDLHLAEKLTLQNVATHFHVSTSTLSHLFQQQLGVSFYRSVIQRRLIAAQTRMLEGESLREVWTGCGFSDYSSFYRLFKKEYGVSPKQFQTLQQQNTAR